MATQLSPSDTLDAVVCDHIELSNCRVCAKRQEEFGFDAEGAIRILADEHGYQLVPPAATLYVVMLQERRHDGEAWGWSRARPVLHTFDRAKAEEYIRGSLPNWPETKRWDDYAYEIDEVELDKATH